MVKAKSDHLLFVLLWLAAITIFAYSWIPGGLDTDSCNYAVISKEILRTNRWLNLYDPIYEGPFYYHFPLCIWVTAFLFKLLGVATFAAKLFSMLCGLVLVAVLYYFGKILKDKWMGFFAGASFLFTNHIIRLSRQCRMDIPVSLFITLAILSFILAQRRSRIYYILFGLFTCLAIFAKDIFGVFPLVIVFIYLVFRLRFKELFHPLFILGLLISILPVFIWMQLDQKMLFGNWYGANFLHLWKHIVSKVGWYYYIWAIATKYFYFLPFAIYGGYLAIREAHKNKSFEYYLLIIWILIFPVAFSFGRQKLHYFILPIYPAASLLVGMAFNRIFKESIKNRIATGLKYILIIGSIIMLCIPLNIRSKRFAETVHLAPFIDGLLKQLPEYEFIIYNEDKSALLFYSQELTRARSVTEKKVLEDVLRIPPTKVRLCYLSESAYAQLSPVAQANCRILVKYKDRIVIVNPVEAKLVITLPK